MAVSPSLCHIHTSEFQEVYAPAEDTYLLIDALQTDLSKLKAVQPRVIVEVGVGSGAVLASLAMTVQDCLFIGVDINPKAVLMSQRTLAANGASTFEVLQGKFLGGITRPDIVVCNPPYVVTTDEEYFSGQTQANITASWAGGSRGRLFIDEFLSEVRRSIAPGGLLYLLVEEQNKPSDLGGIPILARKVVGESLQVLRLEF